MNMRRYKKIVAFGWAISLFCSCGSGWLDTAPTSSTGSATAFETTENAAMAINGLCKMMTRQYLESQGFNGEGTIKMYYGNYPSENFSVNLPGWSNTINGRYLDNTTSTYGYYPWYYYYKLIGNANTLLANIDRASGPQGEKDFIKAQAYTFRAYSYLMLAQLYGNRWADSNEGTSEALVLRTEPTMDDMPLSTLGEVYELIYNDLDNAVRLYKASGMERASDDNYSPDLNVAYAVYARAALTKQDYQRAREYAVLAREGYPLMSVSDYEAGFCTPNSEWIWSSYGALDETLYYYSYFAYIAYNSSASAVRSYPKCISKELYDRIPATDIRKRLFLDPQTDEYDANTGKAASNSVLDARAREECPGLQSNATVYAYMQFKIAAEDMPGVGHLNHFRSSEMYLIEAEADYFLRDEDAARKALLALTRDSGRDPEYACAQTGTELLEEIKKYRAIELWGEGFEWFDLKRWGDAIERKSFADGGNFITVLAVTIESGDNNRWTWRIPNRETDYNHALGKDPASEE